MSLSDFDRITWEPIETDLLPDGQFGPWNEEVATVTSYLRALEQHAWESENEDHLRFVYQVSETMILIQLLLSSFERTPDNSIERAAEILDLTVPLTTRYIRTFTGLEIHHYQDSSASLATLMKISRICGNAINQILEMSQ